MRFAALLLTLGSVAPAQEAGFADPVVAATHKLFNRASTGTCFLVRADGKTHLLTAAHVLEKAKDGRSLLVVRVPTPDGDFRREDRPVALMADGKPTWRRHPRMDAAVLSLDEATAKGTQALDLGRVADAETFRRCRPAMGSDIWTLTYPERLESSPSGFPLLRKGAVSSPTQLPAEKHPLFLADLPAFAGDSGGPAFGIGPDGKAMVIGMVVRRHHHDTKPPGWKEGDPLDREPLVVAGILRSEFLRQLFP